MRMFQLLTCSDIGSCCSDYGLANILNISRKIINIIQLIVPLVLICIMIFELTMLVVNPENQKSLKKIFNKLIAALVIFFIPMLFDITIGILPAEFSLSACWSTAKVMSEVSAATNMRYVALSEREVYKIIRDPSEYEGGVARSNSGVTGEGAERIINIALAELGNNSNGSHHKYEVFGGLSDYDPWCAAFVSWCAGQAGYIDQQIFPKFVGCYDGYNRFPQYGAEGHTAASGYTPKAGDIVFYGWGCAGNPGSHVGIVISADENYIYTVEGNTGCEGEANCGGATGVSRKTRPRDCNIYGYMSPDYPD